MIQHVFPSGKIQDNLRTQKWQLHYQQVHVRHTYIQPHFSVYIQQGAKTPNQHNNLFCTLQCTEQRREKTLSWRGSSGLRRRLEPRAPAIISSTRCLWLHWPRRQLLPVRDLLASPPPLPGGRGLGTSACTPAWPGTGPHSLTPWHPPGCSGSRKRPLWTVPRTSHGPSPKAWAVPVDASIWQDQSMLLVRILGVVGHQLRIAWSLVVFFGHKYDSILPFLPAGGHDAARHSDLAAIAAAASRLTSPQGGNKTLFKKLDYNCFTMLC